MESTIIRHGPRGIHYSHIRRFEDEAEPLDGPVGVQFEASKCPECDCVMLYRGIALLRDGTKVHYFECVHSPREVHSISIRISD